MESHDPTVEVSDGGDGPFADLLQMKRAMMMVSEQMEWEGNLVQVESYEDKLRWTIRAIGASSGGCLCEGCGEMC